MAIRRRQSKGHDELTWVGDLSGRRAMLTPGREALYDATSGKRYTYAELDNRAEIAGTWLTDNVGLKKGDVISFISRNRLEPIDLYFAAGKTGIILAPLSYRLTAQQIGDLLKRIKPKALFYEDRFDGLVQSLKLPGSVKRSMVFGTDDSSYDHEVMAAEPRRVNIPLSMEDIQFYIHTGGTTGTPKVCLVSFRQMIWNSFNMIVTGAGKSGINQKVLLTFPLFHIGGWNTVTPIFHAGGRIVMIREFSADLVLQLVEEERITNFGGVEAMFRMILQSGRFPAADLSSLEYISSAGAPCSAEVMRPFWERGIKMTQSYGLTEGGPSNFFFVPECYDMQQIEARAGSIGFPMFHCDCKIVNPEGKRAAPEEAGELCFRGPHVFSGYLGDPARTESVMDADGWVHSRDLARTDEDGFVYIVGRVDNMYVTGGENVAPEEVEQVLCRYPGIAQITVVGVPDDRWGQVGLAVIVPVSGVAASEDDLKEYSRAHLAGYQVPKYFRFAESLPLTGAGKIDRQALKDQFLRQKERTE